ncbi:MAG: helix-turn-helix domain-containing protein [Betaproteobacteria bacterium]|nr:helix-turn-helix domain-containing protein [Betaproteobacteria bacterium]
MRSPESSLSPREIRRRLGLNQEEFWTRIGVTQSGGSRYESGRRMPKPVRELLRLVHVERIDLAKVRKEDVEIIDRLKSQHMELYQRLRKAARVTEKKTTERGSERRQRVVRSVPRNGHAHA